MVDEDEGTSGRRLWWEMLILACMYAGYMGFILCRTAIYAAVGFPWFPYRSRR